eukprot:Selendium_serpulae@DN3705_c0_g1_i6.p1
MSNYNYEEPEPQAGELEVGEYVKRILRTPPDCNGCSAAWLQFIDLVSRRDQSCFELLPITTLAAERTGRKPHHLPLWRPEGHYLGCSRETKYAHSHVLCVD